MKNNIIHNPKALAAAYITALMLPVLILAYTEKKTYIGIDQASVSFSYTFDLKRKGGAR